MYNLRTCYTKFDEFDFNVLDPLGWNIEVVWGKAMVKLDKTENVVVVM